MKNAGFTKQERSFIALMRIWAVAFLGTGVIFAVSPDYLPTYLVNLGNGLFGWVSSPFPPAGERFWLVLAVALLFTLAYLCAIVQGNLVRNIGYTRPLILAKFVSCVGFAVCFVTIERHIVYFTGALVDGLICVITWRFYHRALKSRS